MPDIDKSLPLIPTLQLKEEKTILDAFNLIGGHYDMIVVIVDSEDRFRGIVSPGDLRKAILNGNSLDTPLHRVMNKKPIYIKTNELGKDWDVNRHIDDLKRFYGDALIFYARIPVVNNEEKVLGLVNVESLMNYIFEPKFNLNNRSVLIVGGAGYIGSVLTRRLISSGWSVRVLDKLLYGEDSLKGLDDRKFTLIHGDAGVIDNIIRAIEGVDAVVYLAELVGDPACSLAPQSTLKTNYLAVTAMAHLCSHLNISRFVYTSSCSVYGASLNSEDFLSEKSALNPLSLYARMKASAEQAILSICALPNPLFVPTILRLGTVFGYSYRPRFDLVINAFVKNAMQKGVIEVFGGKQWRPHIHVSDVAEAVLKVLNAPFDNVRGQIFNVGSNQMNCTIDDLADKVKDVFPNVEIVKKNSITDQRNYRVNFEKIEKILKFKASVGIKEGIIQLKDALRHKDLADLDDAKYSNLKRLKELNYI